MEKLSMCRICLIQDVRMHCIINTNLQETYEKLTGLLLETKDGRPSQVCYICCARLHNTYQLSITCLQSEDLFNQMCDTNSLKPANLQNKSMLQRIHPPIIRMSIDPQFAEKCVDGLTEDNLGTGSFDITVQVKQEPEDIDENILDTEPSLEFTVPKLTNIQNNEDIVHNLVTVKVERDTNETSQINRTSEEYMIEQNCGSSVDQNIIVNSVPGGVKKQRLLQQNASNSLKLEKEVGFKIKKKIKESYKLNENKNDSSKKPNNLLGESSKYIKDYTPYKCSECGKCFTHKGYLRKHMFVHTGEHPFKCDICGKCFMKSGSLSTHKRVHTGVKPFKCDICEKSFMQQSNLTKHTLSHTGEKPHKCDICGKCYFTKSNLDIHIRTHSGPYYCKWCDNWFNQKPILYDHDCVQPRPYKCDVCYKSFHRKDYLSSHALLHSGEQPFKCEMCGKYFRFNSSLTRHIRMHTGARPYKCDICDKYYIEKCNLTKHMRKHADERLLNETDDLVIQS